MSYVAGNVNFAHWHKDLGDIAAHETVWVSEWLAMGTQARKRNVLVEPINIRETGGSHVLIRLVLSRVRVSSLVNQPLGTS